MRINKRKWIMSGTILAILVGGVPYLTGQLVKRQFEDILKVFSELDPVSIQVLNYQEGWLKSKAKTRVTFKQKAMPVWLQEGVGHQDFSIILDHRIHHGPFIASPLFSWRGWHFALAAIDSSLFLTKEAQAQLQQITSDTQLLNIESQIAFSGAFTASFEGKPITLNDDQGKPRTIWQGLDGQWTINSKMNQFTGNVNVPGFDLQWHHRRFVGKTLSYRAQKKRASTGIWLGKDHLQMQQLQMIPVDPAFPIVLTGISVGTIIDERRGSLNAGLNTTVEQVQLGQKSYGPLNTEIALNRIAPEVAKSLISNLSGMQMTGKYQPYLGNLLMQLPALLKTRPELHVDNISLHTGLGDVKGQLQIAIGGSEAHDTMQMGNIVDSIFASAGVRMPQSWVKEILILRSEDKAAEDQVASDGSTATPVVSTLDAIRQKIESDIALYVQSGLLIPQGDHYAMDLRYESGNLTINGNPWPPKVSPSQTALRSL